jgi:hypothetical protein
MTYTVALWGATLPGIAVTAHVSLRKSNNDELRFGNGQEIAENLALDQTEEVIDSSWQGHALQRLTRGGSPSAMNQ